MMKRAARAGIQACGNLKSTPGFRGKKESSMTRASKGILIATAAATLFATGAIKARAEEKASGDKVKCAGINECKGHGTCAGAGNSCAGQNACKGKGVTMVPKAECEKKGGKVVS
jgi:uncharacterized membrane protein